MTRRAGACLAMFLCAAAISGESRAGAFTGYAFELAPGTAANFRTNLTIEQTGEPALEIDAQYATKPFETPWYYVLRAAGFRGEHRWELQMIHHKLYLENNPPEVENFEITHGFNMFTINRTFPVRRFDFRAGAGVVITHTDSTVRGRHKHGEDDGIFGWGYELAGPVAIGGVGLPVDLPGRIYLTPELQLSVAWAEVSIAEGSARTSNIAIHFVLGVGFSFLKERSGGHGS